MSRKRYEGHSVDVTFDADICRHSGNCVRSLPIVFDTTKRPWIQPDNERADAVIAAVARCPSGALQIEMPSEN